MKPFLVVFLSVLVLALFVAVFGIVTDDDVYYGMRAHNANVVAVAKLGQLYSVHRGELVRDPVCSYREEDLNLAVTPTRKFIVAKNAISSVIGYSLDTVKSILLSGANAQSVNVESAQEEDTIFHKKYRLDEFYISAFSAPVSDDCSNKVVSELESRKVCPINKIYRFFREDGNGDAVFAISFSERCLCSDGDERDCTRDGFVKYNDIAVVPFAVKWRAFLNFTTVTNHDIAS